MIVRNLTRSAVLADQASEATTSAQRRQGLLKHERLAPGEGLWIAPCEAVHTFGMKFAIDVVYLSRRKKVLKVRRDMGLWRFSACLRAYSVLELPAGTAQATNTQVGDELAFER